MRFGSLQNLVQCLFVSAVTMPTLIANNLLGDAGLTELSAGGASSNPGVAGLAKRSEIEFGPVVGSNTFKVRYPGNQTLSKTKTSADLNSLFPKVLYKITPCMAVGLTQLIPPLNGSMSLQEIPIIILDQVNKVDIDGNYQTKAGASGFLGICMNSNWGWGLGASYRSVRFDGNVKSSETQADLLAIRVDDELFTSTAGIYARYGAAAFALTLDTLTANQRSIQVNSNLAPDLGRPADNNSQHYFSAVGAEAKIRYGRTEQMVAIKYSKAPTDPIDFSTVELKPKPKDLYDTVSVHVGMRWQWARGSRLLLGAAYEPTSIGPGGRGSGSKAGMGLSDMLPVYLGISPLKPYWQASIGVEKIIKDWRLAVGASYRVASLGIGSEGEQPGAYSEKQWAIPITMSYRFGSNISKKAKSKDPVRVN